MTWILENDIEGCYLEPIYEYTVLGEKRIKVIPLIDGEDVLNNINKKEYVKQIVSEVLYEGVKDQIEAFKKGFDYVFPHQLLDLFAPSELQMLISGASTISVEEMRQYTIYENCNPNDLFMGEFWSIVEKYTQHELSLFLYFVTGNWEAYC